MMLGMVSIRIVEIGVGRFIGLNESLGSFYAQGIAVPIGVTDDGPGLTGLGWHFVRNLKITRGGFGNVRSHTPLKMSFGLFSLVFVGAAVAAALQHSRPIEQGQTESRTKGNIFHAPKNGVSAKRCHGLNDKKFGH